MPTSNNRQLADIYHFLAQAMRYPERDWFDDTFLALYASLLQGLDWETDALPSTGLVTDSYLEGLQVEHTRLFITGAPQVIAPPYASVTLDGVMQGQATSQTRGFYWQHDYVLASSEPPDHLVVELDFLATLAGQGRSCEPFLAELFRPWFGLFKDKVWAGTSEPYYQTTVRLIDFFTCPEG